MRAESCISSSVICWPASISPRGLLRDYIKPLRNSTIRLAMEEMSACPPPISKIRAGWARELGFPDLDDPADPRGYRLLSQVGRLPDSVRDDIIRHFGSASSLLDARVDELLGVEGVGETRAGQLRLLRQAAGQRGRMGAGAGLSEGSPTLRSR